MDKMKNTSSGQEENYDDDEFADPSRMTNQQVTDSVLSGSKNANKSSEIDSLKQPAVNAGDSKKNDNMN